MKILDGVEKFHTHIFQAQKDFFESLAENGQKPQTLFITCSDSRIDPAMITQTCPGELFVIRNAGNLIPPFSAQVTGEGATIEYAVTVLGVEEIVICGHSHCGAISHLVANKNTENGVDGIIGQWLHYADATKAIAELHWEDYTPEERVQFAVEVNIAVQLRHLQTYPSVLKAMANGRLTLHGWVYCIESGEFKVYDAQRDSFSYLKSPELLIMN